MSIEEVEIPVLIIGGGGCGLASSIMLSNLGIDHVLVESHPVTAHLPKASLLSQRTAEILDQHGVWAEVMKIGAPPEQMKSFNYMTNIGGDGPTDHFTFGRIPCYGCNNDPGLDEDYARYRKDSAYAHCNLPLIRLEPLLRVEAEKRNAGKVLFNHRMVSFKEECEYVVVKVLDRATEKIKTFRAQYVIAADGGKTIPASLGIEYEGVRGLADATSIHFKADLSAYWPDDGVLISYLIGLQGREYALSLGSTMFAADWSALVVTGPTWGKKSEEWVLHYGLGQIHPPLESISDTTMKEAIRGTLNIPDLEMEISTISRWHIDGVHAKTYQTDRVFLAGDAAHRHPPASGLGLNTGIGDAHNITWKLAAVLKGHLSADLLKTYQEERQPVGKRVVDWAMLSFMNIRILDGATGLLPGGKQMLPMNEETIKRILSQDFDGSARREVFRQIMQSQRIETSPHDIDLGSIYQAGAIVPDGFGAAIPDPRGYLYDPLARPGHRLPHAYLKKAGVNGTWQGEVRATWLKGQERVSTHHLLDGKGTWVLITDDTAHSDQWAKTIPKNCRIVRIGCRGDFEDETGQWSETSGLEVGKGGAVLVRPDAYVAFRAMVFSEEAVAELCKFLGEFVE